MASLQPADDERHSIDPAQPFRDITACCTSIPPDQRTDIAAKVEELGGVHKYDLTPDVTHLIVGDYDTPKYRHVARERPDIKAMDAAWIEAVANFWKNDEEIDFAALEKQHQLKALEKCGIEATSPQQGQPSGRQSLLICLTGFGEQRDDIASRIVANGGRYTGDLTRRCTHLIVSKPEGKKFTAAKSWNVYTVTLDWLDQSIARGMILEETKFDPLLPAEEQGVGAWVKRDPNALVKRSRSSASNATEERRVRKLRKTASMKLSSQRNNLWGDILGRSSSRDNSFANKPTTSVEAPPDQATPEPTIRQAHHLPQLGTTQNEGVFARCIFVINGFNDKRHTVLEDTITTLGGSVASSLREVAAAATMTSTELPHRFLVVPQISAASSHPKLPSDDVEIVTEFYIEKCLHNKQFFHPSEHVLGRPFPVFPIPGFSDLVICSAAFSGLELNQVARSASQLGAKYEEEFRQTTSVLVCRSLGAMRKDKLKYALEWGVPVVTADWLWECISTGFKVPTDKFIFPELRDRYEPQTRPEVKTGGQPSQSIKSRPSSSRPKIMGGFDASGFDEDSSSSEETSRSNQDAAHKSRLKVPRKELTTSADFITAKSQPAGATGKQRDTPLAEVSGAQLNKSPSPPKHTFPPSRTKSEPFRGETMEKKPVSLSRGPSAPPPDVSIEPTSGLAGRQNDGDEDEERDEAERRQQQSKASERQVLSSKLSDLIQVATGSASSDSKSHTHTAPVRPRRRQLLGRAVSNVSNGSSAASYNGDGSGGSGPRQMTDSLRAAVAAGTDEDDMERETQPPATQLEYADPDAMQMKEEIMNRMMGVGTNHVQNAKVTTTSTRCRP